MIMTNLVFKTRLSNIITQAYQISRDTVNTIEKAPIVKDGKCVGYINKVDIENDECFGVLFVSELTPWFSPTINEITSLEMKIL